MAPLTNPARERLERGELAVGLGLRHVRSVEIARMLRSSGYDWLFIDLEHSAMSIETAAQIAVAGLDAGIAPLVRVPADQFWLATRLLDAGALGIVMPHVNTPDEARAIVGLCAIRPSATALSRARCRSSASARRNGAS